MKRAVVRRALGAAMAACAFAAHAQVRPDAGSVLRDLEKPPPALPQRAPPALQLERPARPALKPAPQVRFTLSGFRITGNTVLATEDLHALVADLVGKPAGFAEIEEAAARITRYYRSRGYPVARAYLPAQDIRDGVVEIAVLEGRVGQTRLRNDSRLGDAVVARHLDGLRGATIEEHALERQLLLIGDLAGTGRPAAALRPGERVGESDLVVELPEAPAVGGSVELDNHGSFYTGDFRLSGQLDLASPLRQGDSLGLRVVKHMPGLEMVRVAYALPLGGSGLRLGLSYGDLRYRLGEDFAPLEASGEAKSAGATLSYPFVRARTWNVYGHAGAARRDFQDRVEAVGSVTDKRTGTASLSLSGDWLDALFGGGANAWSLGYASGRLEIETPLARLVDDLTVRTHGRFRKTSWNLMRLQRAGEGLSLFLAASGQAADRNLDSSEKFSLGGPAGVRAYPLGEASGDQGWLFSGELRYDVSPASLQVFSFYDSGKVRFMKTPVAGASNERRLSGSGVGISWLPRAGMSTRLMVAGRAGTDAAVSAPERRPRVWLQVAQRF
jgi:hemolysin activation/secretion protein